MVLTEVVMMGIVLSIVVGDGVPFIVTTVRELLEKIQTIVVVPLPVALMNVVLKKFFLLVGYGNGAKIGNDREGKCIVD